MMDHDVQAARLLPAMLRRFQCEGVCAARIRRVIEAPFFTDSKTSNGVQVTDVCAYVVRRYLELFEAHRLTPHDEQRFAAIYRRFVRTDDGILAGLHHLSVPTCTCLICSDSPMHNDGETGEGNRNNAARIVFSRDTILDGPRGRGRANRP